MLTWLPQVLLDAGLKVAEQPGWRTRGRAVGPIKGLIAHHTVGGKNGNAPSLRVVTEGRGPPKPLPGPLSQLVLGRDGTYYVVAAGRSNHAGDGRWQGVIGANQGNAHMIGIEAENTGYTEGPLADPWPDVQMDAYARGVAAILKHIGAEPIMACGHKEWAPRRKIDPTFDMAEFRRRVAGIMAGTEPVRPIIPAKTTSGLPTLRRGAQGEHVETLQRKLSLMDDGEFGPITEAAVREFQRKHGLVADGIVGPKTWQLLS